MQKLRVVIADDCSEILSFVSSLLDRQCSIVGRALNGLQAVEAVLQLKPDVLVTDIHMPQMNGIQAVRLLQAAGSTARIIFLTALEDADFISAVLELGPHSYVFKSRCHIDLLSAITAATQGSVFCSSRPKAANPAC